VEIIVRRVQRLLDYKDLSITRFPVGLDSHVEKVIRCIENHCTKVCTIGLWGIGGSGKTAIAGAIYNRIYRTFIGKSFMEKIDAISTQDVNYLLEVLLYNILKFNFKVESVGMC